VYVAFLSLLLFLLLSTHFSPDVNALESLTNLTELNLKANKIKRLNQLHAISCMNNLRRLELAGNDIVHLAGYPKVVFDLQPKLLFIDDWLAQCYDMRFFLLLNVIVSGSCALHFCVWKYCLVVCKNIAYLNVATIFQV
jgi:hypothetical protein